LEHYFKGFKVVVEITQTLYITDRKSWRAWLEENFRQETEIWLIFPHKSSGKPRLPYNDAVEEALCFGWIDSTAKSFEHQSSAQRFSPRTPQSGYSQANKERLRWLLQENRIHPSLVEHIKEIIQAEYIFPEDIIEAIKKDEQAWKNYNHFSEPYKRIRIAYIEAARNRPQEFAKRLENFIEKTRDNKQIGFGGIEKYF